MTQIATYKIELPWKPFNVSLADVEQWMRANAGEHYSGNQAHSVLELWFLEEPTEETKLAIGDYWDGLNKNSNEAKNYVSKEDKETARLGKRASARAKLKQLGLSDEELDALMA